MKEEDHEDKVREEARKTDALTCADRAQNSAASHLSCAHRDIRLALGAINHVLTDHPETLSDDEHDGAAQMLGALSLIEASFERIVARQKRAEFLPIDASDLMEAIFGGNVQHDG